MGHPGSSARIKPQGIGARVLRKEDQRHLQGTGNFVADMVMPGLSEVAFMRSPLAHARITSIVIPEANQSSVLTRAMLTDALDITADSSVPTYQLS